VYRVQDVELGFEYPWVDFCHNYLLCQLSDSDLRNQVSKPAVRRREPSAHVRRYERALQSAARPATNSRAGVKVDFVERHLSAAFLWALVADTRHA
jgi:hypothetical protein